MRYRVFSGPPGTGAVSPLEKSRLLFKEFDSLDGALGWARHLQENGLVALLEWPQERARLIAEPALIRTAVRLPSTCTSAEAAAAKQQHNKVVRITH